MTGSIRLAIAGTMARASATLVLALVCACGGSSGDARVALTVYSPHGKDLLDYYELEFEKANPKIDVQWLDIGSQEILDRLRAESANPQADVWFGAPAETFQRAATAGLLEPFTPTWGGAVDAAAKDAANHWYGTYLTPEVIAYNSVAVPRDSAPHDWDDVLSAKWRGKVLIRDPIASGGMRAIFGAIVSRSLRETGSPEAGYNWLRKLDSNTKEYVINPVTLYLKLGRQEGVITLWNMPDIALQKSRNNIPLEYIFPSSGTPLLVDAIAIVKGGKHPAEARLYYEFVTSSESMYTAAEKFLRIPARNDLDAARLPEWVRQTLSELKVMPLDAAILAQHLDEWMTYWDSNIRNSSRRK